MKKFLFGALFGMLFLMLCGYLFVASGKMPVATKGDPLPFERTLARTALHAAFRGEEGKPSPLEVNEKNLIAGGKVYQAQCAVCHGSPDQSPTAIAKGMFPRPPQLLVAEKGVTDDPVGESYWKIKNGIRLTGMPGYVSTLSDEELWQVTLFVAQADHLPLAAVQAARGVNPRSTDRSTRRSQH